MALGRSHRHDGRCDALLADASAVLPLVPHRRGQRLLRRPLRAHGRTDRRRMTVPRREDAGDARACIATAGLDVARPAAPRAAPSRGGVAAVFFYRARGVLRGADHRRLATELAGQRPGVRLAPRPAWAPAPAPVPAAPAVRARVPGATRLWQVTPGRPRAGQVQHGCEAPPSAAPRRTPRMGCDGGEEGGQLRPGLSRQPPTSRHQVASRLHRHAWYREYLPWNYAFVNTP
jgi:hypothetical protein